MAEEKKSEAKLPEEALLGLSNNELYNQWRVNAAIDCICESVRYCTRLEAFTAVEAVYISMQELYFNGDK